MTTASILIPWMASPDRAGAYGWVLGRWAQHPDVDLVVGSCRGVWCKAEAVANALWRVTTSILVVHDADVWCDGTTEAIEAVRGGAPWAVPHRLVHRLTGAASRAVLDGAPTCTTLPIVQHRPGSRARPYGGVPGGGIVVLPTEHYRRVPLDPRFEGWGQEDEAWGLALHAVLGPPARGTAPLYHLWHTPQPRTNHHIGSRDGQRLLVRYATAARHSPEAVMAIIDEGRGVLDVTSHMGT